MLQWTFCNCDECLIFLKKSWVLYNLSNASLAVNINVNILKLALVWKISAKITYIAFGVDDFFGIGFALSEILVAMIFN